MGFLALIFGGFDIILVDILLNVFDWFPYYNPAKYALLNERYYCLKIENKDDVLSMTELTLATKTTLRSMLDKLIYNILNIDN